MKTRPFKQVDVFTDTAYLGNPLAVVLDGSDLSTSEMQHFAQWTNLSETTFLLPPTVQAAAQGADYRVRIFTPAAELPFAGHPTLGSCHAWLQAREQRGGYVPAQGAHQGAASPKADFDIIVQECELGLVQIRRDGTRLAFAAPPLKRSAPDLLLVADVATALGLDSHHIQAAQLLDNGPLWLGLLLDSATALLQLDPDHLKLKNLGLKVGIAHMNKEHSAINIIAKSNPEARAFGVRATDTSLSSAPAQAMVRAFAAPAGVNEDPVTGSLNASLAQWLIADGLAPASYVATQGTCLGRFGQVYIDCDGSGQVWVGGDSVTCIAAEVML